ncbi:XapX domain-containing protein [Streptomyces kaniharaensis]|uniref:XapX domain-containing protein n=1 Tax=Streptomyces kaniharaensis TaxID=212423 RepID=A0A6N7KWE6_9ACTN|nr:DUF1427 family protein [Streptomyces kaniharaensis]MQS15972.1 XapX domain-containing protein [Streptomyces kaniharaensis]
MTALLQTLLAGLLIGAVYGLLRVKSPAPPPYALVGLAGMLTGYALLERLA